MFEAINRAILAIGDVLLGWLLVLGPDAVLAIVAVLTVTVMLLLRRKTTNQDLLGRADDDLGRLKELMRQARRGKDREALLRYRRTKGQIALKKLGAEGRPLLASLLPIIVLATWAMARLDYHPPRPGETVELLAYTPLVESGGVMHLVPVEGLEPLDGWVRPIEPVADGGQTYGLATWRLQGAEGASRWELELRLGDETLRHPLTVGERTYAEPLILHTDELVTEMRMRRMKLLGIVPGIEAVMLPPWLMGYLVIVLPAYFVLKRALRVH